MKTITKEQVKRLSLSDFKAKNLNFSDQESLEKISGGVLGACHCRVEIESSSECGFWGLLCGTVTWTRLICYN